MNISPDFDQFAKFKDSVTTDIKKLKNKISNKKVFFLPDATHPSCTGYAPFYLESRMTVLPFSKKLEKYNTDIQKQIGLIFLGDPTLEKIESQKKCKSLQDIKMQITGFQSEMEQILHMKYLNKLFKDNDLVFIALFREKLKFYKLTEYRGRDENYAKTFLKTFEEKCDKECGTYFISQVDDIKRGMLGDASDVISDDMGFLSFMSALRRAFPRKTYQQKPTI